VSCQYRYHYRKQVASAIVLDCYKWICYGFLTKSQNICPSQRLLYRYFRKPSTLRTLVKHAVFSQIAVEILQLVDSRPTAAECHNNRGSRNQKMLALPRLLLTDHCSVTLYQVCRPAAHQLQAPFLVMEHHATSDSGYGPVVNAMSLILKRKEKQYWSKWPVIQIRTQRKWLFLLFVHWARIEWIPRWWHLEPCVARRATLFSVGDGTQFCAALWQRQTGAQDLSRVVPGVSF